jgi:CIC family chloride channel protein
MAEEPNTDQRGAASNHIVRTLVGWHGRSKVFVPHVTRLLWHSFLVGVVAGLATLVFSYALDFTIGLAMHRVCGVELPHEGQTSAVAAYRIPEWSQRIWILFVPALGGLLCGLLVFNFAPEAEGHGTDAVIEAFHQKDGHIRRRIPIIKMIASVLTIGTGGNSGREGPIAQVAAGFGSLLGDVLHLSVRRRRILVAAGVGAGVGSMFHAPLGGALFAVEVLYRDTEFEYEALIPAFIGSIVGYTVFSVFHQEGVRPMFAVPPGLTLGSDWYLLLCILLVPFLALVGIIYVKSFYGITALFRRYVPIPKVYKPMLGGLILGAVCLYDPRFLTTGYGWVQQVINGDPQMTVSFLLLIVAAKIVLTGVTIGSGGSGGVFGPSVVIGGLLGGAFGTIMHHWLPGVSPTVFTLLGMGGFFAGVGKVPISNIIMISEMTNGYSLLLPLMLVCTLTYLLMSQRVSIYIKQVPRRVDSPAHVGDFVVDVLSSLTVGEALARRGQSREIVTVSASARLGEIFQAVSDCTQRVFPVLGNDGLLHGIIRLDDLRAGFLQSDLTNLVIAEDVTVHAFEPLLPENTLNRALAKMAASRCSELPIVEKPDSQVVVGMLGREEVLHLYGQRIEELTQTDASPERTA